MGTGGGACLPWDSLGNAGGEGLDWLCPVGCALPVLISVCVTEAVTWGGQYRMVLNDGWWNGAEQDGQTDRQPRDEGSRLQLECHRSSQEAPL